MDALRLIIHRRWRMIAIVSLAALGCGALWAAAATPTYQSSAIVDGVSTQADLGEGSIADRKFREVVATRYGQTFADELQVQTQLGDEVAELTVTAQFAGVAADLADLFAATVQDSEPGSIAAGAASYPTSPSSPNLKRVALVTATIGALAGLGLATLRERLLPQTATTTQASHAGSALAPSEQLLATSWLDEPPATARQVSHPDSPKRETVPRIDLGSIPSRLKPSAAVTTRATPRIVELPERKDSP